MPKALLFAASFAAMTFAAMTFASARAETLAPGAWPSGAWTRSDGGAKVRLYPCGSALCAKNIWVRDPVADEKVGDVLVLQVHPQKAASGRLFTGTAFDRRHNATFDLVMQVSANTIDAKGCMMGGVMCKNLSWARR